MITLCEKCFPEWEKVEVFTSPPLTGCDQCGSYGKRHLFPGDPRESIEKLLAADGGSPVLERI